jgi:hypothetical protein
MFLQMFLVAFTANPSSLPQVLKKATWGDTITLSAGSYGVLSAPRLACSMGTAKSCEGKPRLLINAAAATMTSVVVRSTTGVEITGGFVAASGNGAAVTVDFANNIRLSHMKVSGSRVAFTVVRSSNVDLIGNTCVDIRSDCINIAGVQRMNVTGNFCGPPNPIRAVYDDSGKLIKDGDHPDCIQGWSIVDRAPTADINIFGNRAIGYQQGIWFGNPGQGGYDRITIRNNDLLIGAFNGIAVYEGRQTLIRDNRVLPVRGARLQGGNRGFVWPWVYTTGDAIACGNVVAARASRYGTARCKNPR